MAEKRVSVFPMLGDRFWKCVTYICEPVREVDLLRRIFHKLRPCRKKLSQNVEDGCVSEVLAYGW